MLFKEKEWGLPSVFSCMTTRLFKTGDGVESFVPGHSFTINSLSKYVVGRVILTIKGPCSKLYLFQVLQSKKYLWYSS